MKVTLLSSTLAATMVLGGALYAPASAAETSAPGAAQVAQAAGDMATDLAVAAASGTMGDMIQALLEGGLTADEIATLSDAFDALAASDPAAAATVADAVAAEALAIAGESPQAAVDLVRIAAGTAANQAVFNANPDAASAALGSSSVTADTAELAGQTISGVEVVREIVANAIDSYPEYATLIQENVELAQAQVALADFGDTAAGGAPGAGGGTGGGGGLPSILGNRSPNNPFGGTFRTPAPVTAGGGGGGGGGIPVGTTDSASPT